MKSYIIKQKKCTDCVQPNGTKTTKNGKNIFCTCADCRKRKTTFAKTSGSASGRSVERIVNEGRQQQIKLQKLQPNF